MSTHLATDPTATGTAVMTAARPEWLALSATLTDEVQAIADRDDLVVSIVPGAGSGAPACFYPRRALIEIDGTHLSVAPGAVDPAHPAHRIRIATVWGLLTHECGHAQHTAWEPPDGTPPGVAEAAMLLEEARMEAAQVGRRPDDRAWLRASVQELIMADLHLGDPARAPKMTPAHAAHTAALLLARADGGILTHSETAPVTRIVEDVVGTATLAKLRTVWRRALRTADDDAATMIELGRQWCEIIGVDPDSEWTAGESATPTSAPSPLTDAITTTMGRVASAVAREPLPGAADPAAARASASAADALARQRAEKTARSVLDGTFAARVAPDRTATAGTRPPTDAERSAARKLGRALSTAGVPDRPATKTTSPLPPGRLRMRGVLQREAQRAAGAIPTAEPFTQTRRALGPAPPLRIGVACDVSGSMGWAKEHVASAAWILAHAAACATVPADTATVIFGETVRPLVVCRAGETPPAEVTRFESRDGLEEIAVAIDALDGALGLSRPGAARLLVVVSDGDYTPSRRAEGQKRADRLRAAGCGLLWLTTGTGSDPLEGATVQVLSDPAATARAIGRTATAALRAVARSSQR